MSKVSGHLGPLQLARAPRPPPCHSEAERRRRKGRWLADSGQIRAKPARSRHVLGIQPPVASGFAGAKEPGSRP